jgi:hypothetical protein
MSYLELCYLVSKYLWVSQTITLLWISFGSGMVAHACNLSYLGSKDQDNCRLGPAQAKSWQDSISTNKWIMLVCACHPRHIGSINRKITVQAGPGKMTPFEK